MLSGVEVGIDERMAEVLHLAMVPGVVNCPGLVVGAGPGTAPPPPPPPPPPSPPTPLFLPCAAFCVGATKHQRQDHQAS